VIQTLNADTYNGLPLESNVKATTATLNIETKIITLYDMKSDMIKDTTVTAVLTAPQGELFLTTNTQRSMGKSDMLLTGNVHILRISDGGTMDAPALHYDNSKEKIFSIGSPVQKTFKVQNSIVHCTSERFVANKELTEFEDYDNIHIISQPDTSTTGTLPAKTP